MSQEGREFENEFFDDANAADGEGDYEEPVQDDMLFDGEYVEDHQEREEDQEQDLGHQEHLDEDHPEGHYDAYDHDGYDNYDANNVEEEEEGHHHHHHDDSNNMGAYDHYEPEEESQFTFMREYEEVRQKRLKERDQKDREERDRNREQAEEYRGQLLREREDRLQINKKKNREQEELFLQSMDNDFENVWENVMKYVDITQNPMAARQKQQRKKRDAVNGEADQEDADSSGQTEEAEFEQKDVTRLRKLLIQLKNTATA